MAGRNRMAGIVCAVLGALLLASPNDLRARPRVAFSLADPALQSLPVATMPNYPQTGDGFNAQYAAAVEAYRRGDSAEGERLLEQFRLPHSGEWFAQQFGAEQGEALAKRYDRLFESYVKSTENKLEQLARAKSPKITANLTPAVQGPPPAQTISGPIMKPSGIVALKEPVCFNVHFEIRLTGKADLLSKREFGISLWEDTFAYQDGAFRFVGHGARPFWVWEDAPQEGMSNSVFVADPIDPTAETVDESIPFEMDKVVAALKPAMEKEGCKVTQETTGRLECKRARGYSYSEHLGYGGESVTALVEAKGDQTHVHISTGKGFYGRLGKVNWSVPIYREMVRNLRSNSPGS